MSCHEMRWSSLSRPVAMQELFRTALLALWSTLFPLLPASAPQTKVPAASSADPVTAMPAGDAPYFDPSIRLPAWLPHLTPPLAHAAVPTNRALLPGAERTYRGCVHEGVDFACAPGTPVHAALDGWVLTMDDEPN